MKRNPWKIYCVIGAAAGMLLLASAAFSHRLQGVFFTVTHPLSQESVDEDTELDALKIENSILRARLDGARDALSQLKMLRQELFSPEVEATAAPVISRSPLSWNSRLWIGVGSRHGEHIQKNSPVVVGDTLVGIVDEVYPKKALVRLITDPDLIPSVRAKRGELLLAKGELHGSKRTEWRRRGTLLEGEGFNYDFEDSYGPGRDLRSGASLDPEVAVDPVPLIMVGDLLVTSGMDGLFPEGLKVAEVTRIHVLREGDYYYDLEALPACKNLEEIKFVFVLPPTAP